MKPSRSKRVPLLLTALAVGAIVAAVVWVPLLNLIVPSCEWLPEDRAVLDGIEFDEFTGAPMQTTEARCDTSSPDWLFVEARLSDGEEMSAVWFDMQSVGDWDATYRYESDSGGRWVCYRSSRDDASDVQIVVRSNGIASGRIVRGSEPCIRNAQDDVTCTLTSQLAGSPVERVVEYGRSLHDLIASHRRPRATTL